MHVREQCNIPRREVIARTGKADPKPVQSRVEIPQCSETLIRCSNIGERKLTADELRGHYLDSNTRNTKKPVETVLLDHQHSRIDHRSARIKFTDMVSRLLSRGTIEMLLV